MVIVNYVGYGVLWLLAITWTIGVRVKLDAGIHTILGALFFLGSAMILGVFGINKLHSLWLIPCGLAIPVLITPIFLGIPVISQPLRVLASVFADIVRVGIPSEKIKAAQEAGITHSLSIMSLSSESYDSALKALSAFIKGCRLGIAVTVDDMDEKNDLIAKLVFLGAADCCSQGFKLDDQAFGRLCITMFEQLEVGDAYTALLMDCFVKFQNDHIVKAPIIDGGNLFSKWIHGEADAPMTAGRILQRYHSDSDFPATPGHLYLLVYGANEKDSKPDIPPGGISLSLPDGQGGNDSNDSQLSLTKQDMMSNHNGEKIDIVSKLSVTSEVSRATTQNIYGKVEILVEPSTRFSFESLVQWPGDDYSEAVLKGLREELMEAGLSSIKANFVLREIGWRENEYCWDSYYHAGKQAGKNIVNRLRKQRSCN